MINKTTTNVEMKKEYEGEELGDGEEHKGEKPGDSKSGRAAWRFETERVKLELSEQEERRLETQWAQVSLLLNASPGILETSLVRFLRAMDLLIQYSPAYLFVGKSVITAIIRSLLGFVLPLLLPQHFCFLLFHRS